MEEKSPFSCESLLPPPDISAQAEAPPTQATGFSFLSTVIDDHLPSISGDIERKEAGSLPMSRGGDK